MVPVFNEEELVDELCQRLSAAGFSTLVTAIFFLAGVQLVTIGIVGEYVVRIYEEVKGRPTYIVKRLYRSGQEVHEDVTGGLPENPRHS